MLRSASHRLFPAVKQVAECQVMISKSRARFMVTNIYCYSNGRNPHHLNLLRAVTSNSSWQRRRQLQNPHRHYHDPFTISKMTSGSVFHASIERSSVPLWAFPDNIHKECHVRLYSTKPPTVPSTPLDENHNESKTPASSSENAGKTKVQEGSVTEDGKEKISLVQRFKLMYKRYWYVLIPVHIVTSIVWYGSFFIAAKSGVDIVPLMEKLGAGEKILKHLQSSDAGYYAIAYAMYKIATPARYTVTIGGTTLSINYLTKRGYIKPVPSSKKLKKMYEGKKEELIEKKEELVEKYQEKKGEIVDRYQERKDEMVEIYQEKRNEVVQKVSDKREEFREKVEESREVFKDKIEERKEKLDDLRSRIRKQR